MNKRIVHNAPLRALRYTAGTLGVDVNAFKTTVATVVGGVTYADADLNGAITAAKAYMRVPSVTTAANAGSYIITEPIQYVGFDASDRPRIVKVFLTNVDGGETVDPLAANNPAGIGICNLVSIIVPPMVDTSGAFEFGCGADVVFDHDDCAVSLISEQAAAAAVAIADITGDAVTHTLQPYEKRDQLIRKILDTGTTSTGFLVMV